MGDLYRHNNVASLQLLLELVCCFVVDLCVKNAISGSRKALDGNYVLLLWESTLWLVTQDKSVILHSLEHFIEDLYRHCITEFCLQLLLQLLGYFMADLYNGSTASGNSKAFDGCNLSLLFRATL